MVWLRHGNWNLVGTVLALVLICWPKPSRAAVEIQSAGMQDVINGGSVPMGYADANDTVYFYAAATTDCEDRVLTFTWDFGDGVQATGHFTSHSYGTGGAGNQSVKLTVTDSCGSQAIRNFSIAAISGVEIDEYGNSARFCFSTVKNVTGHALPSGVDGSQFIDWLVFLCAGAPGGPDCDSRLLNSPSGDLPDLAAWPTTNSVWGPNTLTIAIGAFSGQAGDLNLTGGSFREEAPVDVYYEATGRQNPSGDPNWFYYYKDNAGGGDYSYDNSLGRSHSNSGLGMSSVRIADEAYAGDKYITTVRDQMGRLKASGWSKQNYYYANFLGVLAHESQHAINEVIGGAAAGDNDGDGLTDAFEVGTSNTDPGNPTSASWVLGIFGKAITDDEVYAGGPVEQAGVENADTSSDWAHPGTLWK